MIYRHNFCGCCGRKARLNPLWCVRCLLHVGPRHLHVWDRTYFAQHGEDCPYQIH